MMEDIFILIIGTVTIILFTITVPFSIIWTGAEYGYSKEFFLEAKSDLLGIYGDYFALVKTILYGGR